MTQTQSNLISNGLDNTGIGLSVACIIHCLGLPALAAIAPSFSIFAENELLHFGLLALLLPVALISFAKGHKKHKSFTPVSLGVSGIVFLIAAIIFEETKAFDAESILTLCGSLLLVLGHYFNIRLKAQ